MFNKSRRTWYNSAQRFQLHSFTAKLCTNLSKDSSKGKNIRSSCYTVQVFLLSGIWSSDPAKEEKWGVFFFRFCVSSMFVPERHTKLCVPAPVLLAIFRHVDMIWKGIGAGRSRNILLCNILSKSNIFHTETRGENRPCFLNFSSYAYW